MKKFTLATAKSFIKKNRTNLMIKVKSDFDGMTDCVQYDSKAKFVPVQKSSFENENNMGVDGVWFVNGGSRDRFAPRYAGDVLVGFECYNCCGSWEVRVLSAVK